MLNLLNRCSLPGYFYSLQPVIAEFSSLHTIERIGYVSRILTVDLGAVSVLLTELLLSLIIHAFFDKFNSRALEAPFSFRQTHAIINAIYY